MGEIKETIDPSLDFMKTIYSDKSIEEQNWIIQNIDPGFDINSNTTFTVTINQNANFLKPSNSYLYVRGRLQNQDGTAIGPVVDIIWPDISLQDNFFPYLFSRLTYTLNSVNIETFEHPGQCTTMYHLVTKPKTFNGLSMGWALDTYDGQANIQDTPYAVMKSYDVTNFVHAGANPTTGEYVTFI